MESTKTNEKIKTASIENLHADHRKRMKEKFLKYGLKQFSEHEKIELLLYYSIPRADTNPIAHRLLNKFGSIRNMVNANIHQLASIDGIGQNSAMLIKLFYEFMREYNRQVANDFTIIKNQLIAKQYVEQIFKGVPKEEFYVICLSADSRIIDARSMSVGTTHRVDVTIRAVTDYVFKQNCERIIIAHNHPNNTSQPSDNDIRMTCKIFNSCILNDIDILDHIIYSDFGCYSFSESGLMTKLKQTVIQMLKFNLDPDTISKFTTSVAEYLTIPETPLEESKRKVLKDFLNTTSKVKKTNKPKKN